MTERIPTRATRPVMPEGYSLLAADEGDGLLPFSWATEKLARRRNFWLSTVRPDGRPHAMPVWAIEHEGAVYFSTGEDTVKVRNLEARPECVLTTDDADLAVIIEGTVARVEGDLEALSERYHEKYGMHFPPDSPVFRVTPRKVFGFIESPAEFGRTATRWLFDGA